MPEFELGAFRSQVQWSYQQAILANGYVLLIYSIVIMPRGELENYKAKSILLDQLWGHNLLSCHNTRKGELKSNT